VFRDEDARLALKHPDYRPSGESEQRGNLGHGVGRLVAGSTGFLTARLGYVAIKGILVWRRGSESNRRIKVLQTSPLPLGYRALGVSVSSPP
jgi:hypothetical protein